MKPMPKLLMETSDPVIVHCDYLIEKRTFGIPEERCNNHADYVEVRKLDWNQSYPRCVEHVGLCAFPDEWMDVPASLAAWVQLRMAMIKVLDQEIGYRFSEDDEEVKALYKTKDVIILSILRATGFDLRA